MRRVTASVLALAVVLVTGCGSDSDPGDTTPVDSTPVDSTVAPAVTTSTPVGIANPASQFCVEQGGTVEIETADDGSQTGICVLPDGTRVDEWEYFRSEAGSSDTTDG